MALTAPVTAPVTVLVTGASSGVGAGIVEVLAGAGMTVHAVARRADRLEALARGTGCVPHALDVTDAGELAALMAGLSPDVLVCNAGRGGGFAGLARTSRDEVAETIGLNVTATLDLIRLALPGMIERRRGHIVTIGSVAALYPSPSALYAASKAAFLAIARDLRLELRGTGIRTTDIRPGRVASEFYDVANPAAKTSGIRELTPRDIGDAVLYATTAPAHVNVSAIELQPVEQTYGGASFDPVGRPG